MKKFSKLLTLLLALVLTVTAFTVVALATEEQTIEAAPAAFDALDGTLEKYGNGDEIQNSASKIGKFTVLEQDDKNKIVYTAYEAGTGSNNENLDFSWTTRDIIDYPLIAMDMDVMSFSGGSQSSSLYFRLRQKSGTTYKDLNLMTRLYLYNLGLSKTAYEWQHLTVIVELQEDSSFNYYVYIDGKYVKTINDTAKQATIIEKGLDASTLTINYARILAPGGTTGHSAFDNIKVTHYKEGTSRDDIANYYYKNGNYPELYKYTVATVTDSENNVSYFDGIDKAVAAANDGDKVQLFEDVSDTVVINKAISVDTNIYTTDEETGATSITGTYAFDWGSTDGYVADVADGVYTITRSTQLVTVKWDIPCAEDCDCVGNHQLTKENVVVIGEIPEYFYDVPAITEVQGLVTEFLGWSYENDGTADTLVATTAGDVAVGTINLYPVYKQTQYDFSITVEGKTTYYTAYQYAEIVAAVNVADNVERTVTLLRDATVFDQMVLNATRSSKYVKVVFDLRGNTLNQIMLTGNKFVYNQETGEYDSTAVTPAAAYAFAVPNKSGCMGYTTLTVTSSVEKEGTLKSYKVTGDAYFKDGQLEKCDATAVSSAHFVHMYNSKNYTCNVSNINLYAGRFLYASGGSNSNFKFNVDKCNYYEISSSVTADMKDSYTFYFESNSSFTANITNSLFYYQEGLSGTNVFLRCYGKSGGKHNVTVDNCDIIAMTPQDIFNFYSSNLSTIYITPNIQFNNCRLHNTMGNTTYTTYLGDNTLYSINSDSSINKNSISTISAGYVSTPVTVTVDYTLPATTAPAIDPDTKQPIFSEETTTLSIPFTYQVKKCSEVPESLVDVRLSMLYYSNFNMALYLPVTEGVAISSVTGFTTNGDTVKIDGNEYLVYIKELSTANASDTVAAKITYTYNGGTYRQTYNVSALVYADLILNYPMIDVETKAVANMVRYIKEARLASSLEAGTEFDALIALGNLDELGAKEDYIDTTVDYSTLSGYVESVAFMLDGTNAAYVITMTEEATSQGATISVSYVDGAEITLKDSTATANAKYTSGTKVYDVAENAIEITVTVGEETFTGTYSLKAYINATDNTLAKAMYEFGVSAKAYREYLIENT